jgi:hypothetical protein
MSTVAPHQGQRSVPFQKKIRKADTMSELLFACDTRRTAIRRVAGVFGAEDNALGTQLSTVAELAAMLAPRVRRQGDMSRQVHGKLIEAVLDELVEHQRLVIGDDGVARMSPKFLERQLGVSRQLRTAKQHEIDLKNAGKRSRLAAV